MTPRQFRFTYGLPKVTRVAFSGSETVVIPENPDRYLLGFLDASSAIRIWTGVSAVTGTSAILFSLTSTPLLFSHELHGSLVNMSFAIVADSLPCELTWVEGTATPVEGAGSPAARRPKLARRVTRVGSANIPPAAVVLPTAGQVVWVGERVPPEVRTWANDRGIPIQFDPASGRYYYTRIG